MSGLLLVRALLFAGECFAASLILPLLGFAVTALMRRAALRHLVWATLFGVLMVLPFVALLLPARQVMRPAAAPVMEAQPVMLPAMPAPALVPMPAPSWSGLLTAENIVLFVVALWLAGLVWQVLRLGLGGIGLMRLRRRSEAFASEIETGCAVRLSHGEAGPSTFGILRPVVLLPRSAQSWPSARLEAVLRHEAAHVARRDVAAQFIARLVCALYWINPLLWLAYRALRREAELAADDAVVAGGMTPSLYATELVRLAAEARGITPGVAMAGPPLTKRIEAVLSDNVSRKGVTRMDMARMGLLGLTATLLLGAARFDLAVAQDAPATVERTVEKNVAIEVKAEAEATAIKAKANAAVAKARAKAAAETDPVKREQYRKEAEKMAAEAGRAKADAERLAASVRTRAAEARRTDSEMQRAAMASSEAALARTQEALAKQAQAQARDKADPGKQQLMQLMADSVAVAQQEMAKARARVEADRARAASVDYNLDYAKTDGDGTHMDFGFRLMPDGAEITPEMAKAMQQPEVRQAIDAAVRTAMLEARKAIKEAITKATGHSLPSDARDIPAPPAPPAPPAARAIPAPPAPPAAH